MKENWAEKYRYSPPDGEAEAVEAMVGVLVWGMMALLAVVCLAALAAAGLAAWWLVETGLLSGLAALAAVILAAWWLCVLIVRLLGCG